MVFFGISVFGCFGYLCFLLGPSALFVSLLASCVFYFVVFCFASFRFLFALLADATILYVFLFLSLHFVCLASFRFVVLRFASFASLLLFFCVCLVSSSLFRVSVFFVFRRWFSFLWVWTTTPEPDSQLWYVRACALVSSFASFCFTCFSFVFFVLVTFDCRLPILQFGL